MNINEIAILEVKKIERNGSTFISDNGKEYFLPEEESLGEVIGGEKYLVMRIQDKYSDETYLTEKIESYLKELTEENELSEGDIVGGVVLRYTPTGVRVAINNKYVGLLHNNENYRDLEIGQKIKLFVKKIREDNKIDLAIWKGGYKSFIDQTTEEILIKLKKADGFLPYSDYTDSETIQKVFQISKKKFKESIGKLYKQRKITISNNGIRLVK